MVKKLMNSGHLSPHDKKQKIGKSGQDYYECTRTHEIYVARKKKPEWFEPLYINTRSL